MSVLLSSNDKNYKFKRSFINELSSDFDENNKEYLKFKNNTYEKGNNSFRKIKNKKIEYNNQKYPDLISKSSISAIINDNRGLENDESIKEIPAFLNNLEYYRTPKVIINNEKIMLHFLKKKNMLIKKIPYLSRSRNDLIIYDYKKNKDKTSEPNRISKDNNYLKNYFQMSDRRKNHAKKILKISTKNKYNNFKIGSCPSIFTNKYKFNKDILPNIKNNFKSMIIKQNNNKNFITSNNEEKEKVFSLSKKNIKIIANKYKDKYKIIERLNNKDLLKKLKNSVENCSSLGKVVFDDDYKIKNPNKIHLLFGKNIFYE